MLSNCAKNEAHCLIIHQEFHDKPLPDNLGVTRQIFEPPEPSLISVIQKSVVSERIYHGNSITQIERDLLFERLYWWVFALAEELSGILVNRCVFYAAQSFNKQYMVSNLFCNVSRFWNGLLLAGYANISGLVHGLMELNRRNITKLNLFWPKFLSTLISVNQTIDQLNDMYDQLYSFRFFI